MTNLSDIVHAFNEHLGPLECSVSEMKSDSGDPVLDFALRGEWHDSVQKGEVYKDTSWGKTEPALPDASWEKDTDLAIYWEKSITRHLPGYVYTRRAVNLSKLDALKKRLEHVTL